MTKELLISSSPHETKVAVLEDDQLVEVYFQRDAESGLVGGIYKGRVNRVLPGMQSAFVDIGLERDAFLYVSDFFEDSEEYDRVFTEAENRVAKISDNITDSLRAPLNEPPHAEISHESSAPEIEVAATTSAAVTPPAIDDQPLITPEASGAQQAQTPPGTIESTQTTPPPPKEEELREREFQRRDFPGRRHRRRGRGFRENRFGFRRSSGERPPDHRSEGPSQPLEPLPGESLAKYNRPSGNPSESPASGPTGLAGVEDFLPETYKDEERPIATLEGGVSGPSDSNQIPPEAAASLESSFGPDIEAEEASISAEEKSEEESMADESGASEESPLTGGVGPEIHDAPESEELNFDLALEAAEGALAEQAENEAGEPEEEQEVLGEELDETDVSAHDAEIAAGVGPEGFPTGSASDDLKSAVAGSDAVAFPPETSTGEPGSGQSYTLRDPHRRQHTAPRRGRKGGRGRFRGRHGRRSEGGVESPRGGNHQSLPISELLKEGQEILVQIAKEPLGTKGARITSHIALPGRYLVYMPTISHIGVSRKISSEEERLRLRNIILENRGPLTGGFIVRTAGAGRSEEELKADLAFLSNLWNDIRTRADRSKAPALLHRDLTLVERILRDLLSPDFKCLRTDNEIEYEHVLDFVNRFQPALVGHVKLYTRDTPLFEEFGVQAEIDKALKPKVWLKSGGYIVINQTEALVAIDVNTGKYVGKTNRLEDTIVRTNIDAVIEIVRQIRLRDLGGIIVIDFIDMDERRNRAKVVQALEDALRRDRAPTKILSFNEFGLVALTRKRAKQSLERTLCEPCPYCTGAGWVKSVATVSNEIVSEARKMASEIEGKVITLRVNPQVAANLKSKDGVLLSEIEAVSRKDVVIKSDPAVHQERFEIF